MMRRDELEKYARENGIRFSQVLGWYVLGIVLYLTEQSGFYRNLVIMSPFMLDPHQDRHILDDGIVWTYYPDEGADPEDGFRPGCPYTDDFRERLIFRIQEMAVREKFPLRIKIATRNERPEFYYDEMYVPLDINIREGTEGYPEPETFDFFDPEIKSVNVMAYSAESVAAAYLTQIMEQLELINEMEVYLYMYLLLTHRTISGREICESIKRRHNEGWKPSEEKYEMLKSYGQSTFMKKKWKVLLRRHGLKEPSWEQVMTLLTDFTEPIYNSLTTDIIFFADWMPDLGRYLD